ncbi:hypothetical protein [Gottfriedia acidiceleris]|uniref:hypothetical protein n=1 Tax=Gottfriedia acidiceleris TaxID=371036 RepID=UPI00101BB285|nr:hypothetical protein [Gottfriedia acidiceleris]
MTEQWIKENTSSTLHKVAIGIFGISTFLSFYSMIFPIIGVTIFFCFTALPRLWRMLLFLAISAIIVTVLPFLAPIAVILMIIFFVMRLNYIFKNWKAVLGGLLVYGSFSLMISSAYGRQYTYGHSNIFIAFIFGIMATVLLHFFMKFLYDHGYSSSQALEIMGAVLIVLIALVLPFLKMFDFADFSLFHGASDTVHVSEGTVDGPVVHTEGSSTGVHNVNSHMRTAPDGIIENNLSYHGPDKIPNTPTVHVDSYVRSNADGIVENNLSYNDASQYYEANNNINVPSTEHTIMHNGNTEQINTVIVGNEREQKEQTKVKSPSY